jgi:hypothetical protein
MVVVVAVVAKSNLVVTPVVALAQTAPHLLVLAWLLWSGKNGIRTNSRKHGC